METTKIKKSSITFIGLLFIAYITATSCVAGNAVLYGGYIMLMAFAVVKLMFDDGGRLVITGYSKRLVYFALFSCASIFWAYNKKLVLTQIPLIVACIIMTIVMTDYFIKRKDVETLFIMIAIVGFVMAIYVITTYGGLSSFYSQATAMEGNLSSRRLGGDITNTNTIGIRCGYSTIVLFFFAYIKKKKLCYFLMLIPFIVTAASGSRKALLMIVLGFVMIFYYKQIQGEGIKRYIKIYFGIFIVVLAMLFIFSLDIMNTTVERMKMSTGAVSGSGMDGSTAIRLEMIKVGLEQYWKHPVLGVGLGNARIVNAMYMGYSMYSHNDYIELMLNGGLIGMMLYYGLMYKLLKEHIALLKKDKRNDYVALSMFILIIFLLMNLANVSYYNSIPTYAFFVVWISVLETHKKGAKESEYIKPNN